MKLIKYFIIFYLVFNFSNLAYAVTLEECRDLSLRNSKLLESYANLIASTIYSNRKDKSALFPQVSVFYEPDYVQYNNSADFTRHGFRNKAGLTLSYDIQKLLANYPQLSNLEIEKSKLIKKAAESEILKNLTQDYYKLYVFLKKKHDYIDAQTYVKEHIQDIEDMQLKGVDIKLDLIRAQVQLKSLYISTSNANEEIDNTLISLNSMMNTEYKESDFSSMDAPDIAALETDQTVFDESLPENNTEKSYIENAEKTVPQKISDLEQSKIDEFDVKITKEKYRQSKFSYLPSLQAGVEHNAHTIDPSIEAYRTYLAVNFDLFDFGQRANAQRELKYSYESQKKLFEETQRKLKVRVEQLITELENIQTTYKNACDNLNNAKNGLDTAKDYYQQGKIKETDLLSVFSDYLNVKDQSYESLYNFLSKKAELDSIIKGLEI